MTPTRCDEPPARCAPDEGATRAAFCQRVLAGLRAGEFRMAYQGIYSVESGDLARLEALVRWQHPQYGLLLPGAFADTFDDPDVAAELTAFVIDTVCRELAQWQHDGGAVRPVAINVPPSVAATPGFAQRLQDVCRVHGIEPRCLEIELSEGQDLARFPDLPKVVKLLRMHGVGVAMDDFGTGYACLAALCPTGFSTVKVAKELLSAVPACPNACAVVSAVVALMTQLCMTVVVEGVETAAQAQWLAQWPQLLAQGFFLARPSFGIESVPGARTFALDDAHRMRAA